MDILDEIGLRGRTPPQARATFGPDGKLDAYAILQDVKETLTSGDWFAVANAFTEGFALHINVFPEFDYTGVLLSINMNTDMEFTMALTRARVSTKHNLLIKLPGLNPITYLIPEVDSEWIRFDLLYRGDALSLYRNCELIARQILPQELANISRTSMKQSDEIFLPNSIEKVRIFLMTLNDSMQQILVNLPCGIHFWKNMTDK